VNCTVSGARPLVGLALATAWGALLAAVYRMRRIWPPSKLAENRSPETTDAEWL
jgi:hypothetical protein